MLDASYLFKLKNTRIVVSILKILFYYIMNEIKITIWIYLGDLIKKMRKIIVCKQFVQQITNIVP